MIRFRCSCGRWLTVARSEAGGAVQCAACGRLRSVPELDELNALEEDGTFRLGESTWQERQDASRRPRMDRTNPETGELITELDLAVLPERREDAATTPLATTPVALAYATPTTPPPSARHGRDLERRSPPAIEPVLVAQAALAGPAAGSVQPATPDKASADGRPPTLAYAQKHDYGRFVTGQVPIPLVIRPVYWYSVPLELLQPANALVLGIVFVLHLVMQFFAVLTVGGVLPFAAIVILLGFVVLAHYVDVVDETGPERRDELPAVLRNLSFTDDFGGPIWSLLVSLAICFVPALALVRLFQVATSAETTAALLVVGAGALGLWLFPAVLLTTATSGSIWNLAPHRVLRVLFIAPAKWMLALLLLLLALVTYAGSLALLGILTVGPTGIFAGAPPVDFYVAAAVGYPALLAAIYFAHGFGWVLGRIHQEHHEEFPWVLQRHVSRRALELRQAQALRRPPAGGIGTTPTLPTPTTGLPPR